MAFNGVVTVALKDIAEWAASNSKANQYVDPCFTSVEVCNGLEKICPKLGSGSYGTVFKAIDPCSNEPIAIKLMKKPTSNSSNSSNTSQMFRLNQEATLQRVCQHDNICKIINVVDGPNAAAKAIIMEFADTTLRHVRCLVLEESNLKCLFWQLLNGVAAIHRQNIIHRDIKPCNILLNAEGAVKITDFGLAGYAGHNIWLGNSPDLVVTANYRPPDMLLGAAATT
ncbi:Extracellular signal-regulated kinase 2 [Tetrabaena socialis]|uniref:Extracellular signal-regulated kinase 2 n=1 Tax=Tetrabaena socialis TaxID=47790 RepID=A0A2J7ZQP9_9CHLO|nr:Extracellular signal-regulated kinase 2 [Tetrabaena socialis]|eukprot:PNH02592.1 Extracellular signal-regulated kinase 2 [Tetrabaena socialis]